MDLGIKLVLDKESVEQAKKILGESFQIDTSQVTAEQLVGAPAEPSPAKESKKDVGMAAAIGGAIGGAMGGIFGELIKYIQPIGDILKVIGAVITIGLSPLLPLLKIFLVFSLWIFKKLKPFMETLTSTMMDVGDFLKSIFGGKEGKASSTTTAGGGNTAESWAGIGTMIVGAIVAAFAGLGPGAFVIALGAIIFKAQDISNFLIKEMGKFWAGVLATVLVAVGGVILFAVGGWVLALVGLLTAAVVAFWPQIVSFFKNLGKWFSDLWDTIKSAFSSAWDKVKSFGRWLWDSLVSVFTKSWEGIKSFGSWLWNSLVSIFTKSFDAIKNIGSWLWDKIKSFAGGLFGGKSTSHNDVLITSSGEVHDFNPNDNLIAVQDLGTLGKMGGNQGQSITINVQGFVGDENELAYKVSKALQNYSRGKATQW